MKRLIILGAGGFSRTVADLAAQLGTYDKIAFLDDLKTGPDILGKCSEFIQYLEKDTEFYPAFGNNTNRLQWIERILSAGGTVPTLIHPRAYVSPTAVLGIGTVVLAMAVVNTGVIAEKGCILNIGALVDHDCILEAGIHLCPGVIVKAENRIPAGKKIESGEVILARNLPL